ncbi:hypothetical protein CLCR_04473 [Cladophialophora carrionii]|uniref:Uncharacterized protein n=1 Tax=Cladophialophora carrionii TaxID=86049 RepID=A0A1C1CHT4_9EURO|nr:hypothetical protein CLCR_04473 [Cladophialophora carrionii]
MADMARGMVPVKISTSSDFMASSPRYRGMLWRTDSSVHQTQHCGYVYVYGPCSCPHYTVRKESLDMIDAPLGTTPEGDQPER